MDVKVVQLDGSKYPYKSKKKRIYNKWLKKHIIATYKMTNVTPNKITMKTNHEGTIINAYYKYN